MLSGCSFIPIYERPPLPTAETYPREECTENSSNVQQLCWQDFFTDPALQELILLGLNNNRDLRIAIGRIYEARAVYGHSWADLFPTVDANALRLRTRLPGDLLKSTFTAFSPPPTPGTPTPSAPSNPGIIFSGYLAALSVNSWEVDFWGRLRSLKDAALEEYLASEEAAHATYISLIGQIANSYLIELELNELVSIAQKTVESRQKSYHLLKRRSEEGSSSKYEAIQAETLLQQAKADLTVLERKRELNWNAITLLVGAPIMPDMGLLSVIKPYFIKEICPGLPSELLCNRPDVLAAEHKLKAANANIGAARAAFFPTISLTGAYGSASNELKNLFCAGSKFWLFFPSISVPIFDWGRNLSDLGLAKARRNIAVSEYEHTIQVAFREVADALAERTWLAEQVTIQTDALTAQTERARLAWIRYEYGTSPYLEFLDSERDRFSAEQNLVQTQRAFLASGVNLFIALGGGYCCTSMNASNCLDDKNFNYEELW
ncbi:MAG: transporter [Verrucomicrobia bacterium]|nr:MAG: transporter [Verrucomicrobiota bacterium]